MAAGFLPPALTEVTAALFTYILLHVRIRIFLAHGAHLRLLPSSASPQPASPRPFPRLGAVTDQQTGGTSPALPLLRGAGAARP